jgi:fatty-acyl-CoA synthase
MRRADFSSLADALDYAAQGVTGYNFYDGRGELYASLPYRDLRDQAQAAARRFDRLGLQRGARVALIAETHPDFMRLFFACQYAGLTPVPMPVSINLGSRDAYVDQLRRMLARSGASVAIAPSGFLCYLEQAAIGLELVFAGDAAAFDNLPERVDALQPSQSTELAYLQYTSGSTRFPRGVMITQEAVMANLSGIIEHGVQIRPDDRCMSWLPYYHDMGLVGLILVPLASQISVDYLGTREFAMRPRQWLNLMDRNQATISFGPPFGYELVARRLRAGEAEKLDLRRWRVAGVGAELIRPAVLERFAEALAPSGFDPKAFLPCYGMAEASLAVSFAPLCESLTVDRVDGDYYADHGVALPLGEKQSGDAAATRVSRFVDCGAPLPDHEVEIRDGQGRVLPERHGGTIFVRGPSVMSGYFNEPEITREHLASDGWLNTGDIGYRIGDRIVISGREKDLIIVNGRNIWPQDLEYIAEQQPEVRTGDALAFAAPGPEGEDATVLVVQCRVADEEIRADLVERIQRRTREELAIDIYVQLVPLHTLPRTSSGKLSRSRAQQSFITAYPWENGSTMPVVAPSNVEVSQRAA